MVLKAQQNMNAVLALTNQGTHLSE